MMIERCSAIVTGHMLGGTRGGPCPERSYGRERSCRSCCLVNIPNPDADDPHRRLMAIPSRAQVMPPRRPALRIGPRGASRGSCILGYHRMKGTRAGPSPGSVAERSWKVESVWICLNPMSCFSEIQPNFKLWSAEESSYVPAWDRSFMSLRWKWKVSSPSIPSQFKCNNSRVFALLKQLWKLNRSKRNWQKERSK
jgi:hypothetical protein